MAEHELPAAVDDLTQIHQVFFLQLVRPVVPGGDGLHIRVVRDTIRHQVALMQGTRKTPQIHAAEFLEARHAVVAITSAAIGAGGVEINSVNIMGAEFRHVLAN